MKRRIDVNLDELDQVLDGDRQAPLSEADYDKLKGALPAATQWEIVEEAAELLKPARNELIRQAAQSEVLHNDDTSMRVLKLQRPEGDELTGVFTSGIVSTGEGWKIALFFTGREHAARIWPWC